MIRRAILQPLIADIRAKVQASAATPGRNTKADIDVEQAAVQASGKAIENTALWTSARAALYVREQLKAQGEVLPDYARVETIIRAKGDIDVGVVFEPAAAKLGAAAKGH